MAGIDLLPGERILWEERPLRLKLFRSSDAFLIPFSLVWSTFTGSIFVAALIDRNAGAAVGTSPFALIGLYFTVGRFIVRAVTWRSTRYLVTDRRLLVIAGLSGTKITSTYLSALPPPVLKERPDRSGNLAFGEFPGVWESTRSNGWRAWASEPSSVPVLWNIPEVRIVRDLVANAQRERSRPD